jgi:hypothetical protein
MRVGYCLKLRIAVVQKKKLSGEGVYWELDGSEFGLCLEVLAPAGPSLPRLPTYLIFFRDISLPEGPRRLCLPVRTPSMTNHQLFSNKQFPYSASDQCK